MSAKAERHPTSTNPKKNPRVRRQRPRIGTDQNGNYRREDGAFLFFRPHKPARSKYTPK